jgi:hypothetical protein
MEYSARLCRRTGLISRERILRRTFGLTRRSNVRRESPLSCASLPLAAEGAFGPVVDRRLSSQTAEMASEVQLEIASLADAALAQLWQPLLDSFPSKRLEESVLRRLQRSPIGQPRLIDDRFHCLQRLLVEGLYAAHKIGDKSVEFRVRYRPVDPAVAFRGVGVEVVGP